LVSRTASAEVTCSVTTAATTALGILVHECFGV
jgi:hypothetical protein